MKKTTRTTTTRVTVTGKGSPDELRKMAERILERENARMERSMDALTRSMDKVFSSMEWRDDPVVPGVKVAEPPELNITPKPQEPPKAIVLRKPGLIRRVWYALIRWIW